MKKFKLILLPALLLVAGHFCDAQKFEGILKYKVEYELKDDLSTKLPFTKDELIDKMKADGDFFDTLQVLLKGGDYIKFDNSEFNRKVLYLSSENKIYNSEKSSKLVIVTSASATSTLSIEIKEPEIIQIDSTYEIFGRSCQIVRLKWEFGTEDYYYDPTFLNVDSNLFSQHKFEFLDLILAKTNSYPVRIVKSLNNFISVSLTLVEHIPQSLSDEQFALPDLRKASKKELKEFSKLVSGDIYIKRNE